LLQLRNAVFGVLPFPFGNAYTCCDQSDRADKQAALQGRLQSAVKTGRGEWRQEFSTTIGVFTRCNNRELGEKRTKNRQLCSVKWREGDFV
jgi:hypothetical protein